MKKFNNFISGGYINESYISNSEILDIIKQNYEEVSIKETNLYDGAAYMLPNGNLLHMPSPEGRFDHRQIFNDETHDDVDYFIDRLHNRYKNNKKYLDHGNIDSLKIAKSSLGLIRLGTGTGEVTIDIGKKPTKFQYRSLELYIMYYLNNGGLIRVTMTTENSNNRIEIEITDIEDIQKIQRFYR